MELERRRAGSELQMTEAAVAMCKIRRLSWSEEPAGHKVQRNGDVAYRADWQ